MKRLIFVDDEPKILDGLRNMLRSKRREWEMVFVTGSEAALREFETQPFDVIVSDMRMPLMDGASLLRAIQERYPKTIRIVLSGYSELQMALRSVPTAHQYLSKPCDPDFFKQLLERACALDQLLPDEGLRAMIGGMCGLPSVPYLYDELNRALADPGASLPAIAELIEQDMAMATKVLQIVNSAFFGAHQRTSNVRDAVQYLGLDIIRTLLLSVELFNQFPEDRPIPGFSVERFQRHSVLSGRIARGMMQETARREDAYTAGLLHDIGVLLKAVCLPDRLALVHQAVFQEGGSLMEAERAVLGTTHADVGAYLVGLWGLPDLIVEAVAHHHEALPLDHGPLTVRHAVQLAEQLAYELAPEDFGPGEVLAPLDPSDLERLGIADLWPEWRQIGREYLARLTVEG